MWYVTTESVNLDLAMERNILWCICLCLVVWLCLKMGSENMVLKRLLQIGAKDLTAGLLSMGPTPSSFDCYVLVVWAFCFNLLALTASIPKILVRGYDWLTNNDLHLTDPVKPMLLTVLYHLGSPVKKPWAALLAVYCYHSLLWNEIFWFLTTVQNGKYDTIK